MKKKLTILIIMLCFAAAAFMLTACENQPRRIQFNQLTGATYIVTYSTITITSVGGTQASVVEYSLNGNTWQTEPLFTGSTSNTQYSVHMRQQEDTYHYASESFIKNITTLRMEQTMPNVNHIQSNRTIILVGVTDAMEVAFDGVNFESNQTSHTFTTNGNRTIRVRYAQTERAYASAAQEIAVVISNFYGGQGTADNPFQVSTFEQLQAMTGSFYFKLVDDIQFPDELQGMLNPGQARQLDGNGFSFLNPRINASALFAGIFATFNGSIINLTVYDAKINLTFDSVGQIFIGILVGNLTNGNIVNTHVCGVISAELTLGADSAMAITAIGGLTGRMSGTAGFTGNSIINSSADVEINFVSINEGRGRLAAGGLSGRGQILTVENSYANISIDARGMRLAIVGGLVGGEELAQGMSTPIYVRNSFATGEIVLVGAGNRIEDVLMASGVVGRTMGIVENAYSTVDISISGTNQSIVAGGISGLALRVDDPIIRNTFFAGSIATILQNDITGYILWRSSIVNHPPRPGSVANSFHIDSLIDVDETRSTAVTENDLQSTSWQRANLDFCEDIWLLQDGEFPGLR